MARLQNRIAIVTGSSSGIGKAIALTFAREGARVVVAARRTALCETVAQQIRQEQGEALAVATDVTDDAQVQRLIDTTLARYGRLDILVNNAGIGGSGPIAETPTDLFDRILNTNLRGTFFCSRAGFRAMKPTGGIIINMASVAGVQAWAGTGAYSASKFAIMGVTKAMADEGRPHNIKVCAICPGGVADELVDAGRETILASGAIDPFDVAETAVYLASLGPHAIVQQVVIDRLHADW